MTLTADVVIVGGGLIGCSTALAAADRGATVVIVHSPTAGESSPAAAGLLAPSIERFAPAVYDFMLAARSRFPAFVADVEQRSGAHIELERPGILDIALEETQVAAVRARLPESAVWLDDSEVRRLEPELAPTCGGVLWEEDGYVDNVTLARALETALERHKNVRLVRAEASALTADRAALSVAAGRGVIATGPRLVLAAGAWSARISGAPCASAVEPVRGQLVAFGRRGVNRPVHCCDSYLVPRRHETIAGSTMERVGYDPATTGEVVQRLTAAAAVLCPSLTQASRSRAWAGLRPVTPDLLPLIGPDPDEPRLIYACGHSRNGILMAPVTALAVCQLLFEDDLTFDLTQFRADRFRGTFTRP